MLVLEYAARRSDDVAPAEVRDVVAARFEGASPTTRQVVGAAAVIGTVADPELLRVACGRDESETVDAIEEAITRGLLVERIDRPGYDVPHELVRDAALARLSLARIRLLHGRVADLLARRHAVDPIATPAGAVARHLSDAGRHEEAGVWFLRAAEDASRLYAHAEALEQLRAALASGYRALEVHEGIGIALVRLGRYADALVSLDRAGALAEDDPPRQAAIEHAIAGVYDRLGEPVLAQAHLEAARDLAGADGHGRAARILADLALVQHRRGDDSGAERAATGAIRLAQDSGDEAARAQAENVLGVIATARGDHATASTRLDAAAARARRLGDLDLLIAALNNLSRAHQANGSADEALGAAREALEWAERQGDRHRLAALHSHLADLLHAAGREEEAVAQLKMSASAFAQLQEAQTRPEVWTLTEW
jgi:tetratricopeptide (TPR) repeat protein